MNGVIEFERQGEIEKINWSLYLQIIPGKKCSIEFSKKFSLCVILFFHAFLPILKYNGLSHIG